MPFDLPPPPPALVLNQSDGGGCKGEALSPAVVRVPTGPRRKLKPFAYGGAYFTCAGHLDRVTGVAQLQLKFPRGWVTMDEDQVRLGIRLNPREAPRQPYKPGTYRLFTQYPCSRMLLPYTRRSWRVVGHVQIWLDGETAIDHFDSDQIGMHC